MQTDVDYLKGKIAEHKQEVERHCKLLAEFRQELAEQLAKFQVGERVKFTTDDTKKYQITKIGLSFDDSYAYYTGRLVKKDGSLGVHEKTLYTYGGKQLVKVD